MNWQKRATTALERKGWSIAELARRTKINYDRLYKQLGTVDNPRGDTLKRIASALGVNEYWLRTGDGLMMTDIPVAGYVSAGDAFVQFDDVGHLDSVPVGFGDQPIAVEVRGTSMLPVYRPGDRLLGDKRETPSGIASSLNRDCIVMTTQAEGYLKRLVKGSRAGSYTLRSYNPDFSDIEDVAIQWVAPIMWVRRGP